MKLHKILLEFIDVFVFSDSDLGQTHVSCHKMPTKPVPSIKQQMRRIQLYCRKEVSNFLCGMLAHDIIQQWTSPWASLIVIIRQKDGSARFCVNYCKLNAVTRRYAYPFPRIDNTIDTLSGSQWFSTLDLLSGYWQVEVAKEDTLKVAYATHDGMFEFKLIPFRLCNEPATFQWLVDLSLFMLSWYLGKPFKKPYTIKRAKQITTNAIIC